MKSLFNGIIDCILYAFATVFALASLLPGIFASVLLMVASLFATAARHE